MMEKTKMSPGNSPNYRCIVKSKDHPFYMSRKRYLMMKKLIKKVQNVQLIADTKCCWQNNDNSKFKDALVKIINGNLLIAP